MEDERPDRDERTAIPLDPEEALRGLLEVDPESEPAEDELRSPAESLLEIAQRQLADGGKNSCSHH